MEFSSEVLMGYAINVVAAIAILIIGFIIAGRGRSLLIKSLKKTDKVDDTLAFFFGSLVRYTIIALTIIIVLERFGVETTSLVALLGAAGLAIGLALQGTLSNVAAGVMLLFFRPFKIGDFVEVAGISGTVKAITLFVTELATGDNVHIIVPNSDVWGTAVKNYSFHPTRRIDLIIGVGYDDNLDKARDAILSTISADGRSHSEPAPTVAVAELADSSVNFVVRIWCDSGDYWALKWDLTKAIKEKLDQEGLSIPYPQHDVHMINNNAA